MVSEVKAVIELASLSPFAASDLVFLNQFIAIIAILLSCIQTTMETE